MTAAGEGPAKKENPAEEIGSGGAGKMRRNGIIEANGGEGVG